MNIYKDRLWLALLTGIVSLCMGFSEFYTWRIGWHPGSSPWNREALLHGSDMVGVLALSVLTFVVISLFMKYAGSLSSFSEKIGIEGSPLEAPFALIMAFLLLAWMPFFLCFIRAQA